MPVGKKTQRRKGDNEDGLRESTSGMYRQAGQTYIVSEREWHEGSSLILEFYGTDVG